VRTLTLLFCLVPVVVIALYLIIQSSLPSPPADPHGSPVTAVADRKRPAVPEERKAPSAERPRPVDKDPAVAEARPREKEAEKGPPPARDDRPSREPQPPKEASPEEPPKPPDKGERRPLKSDEDRKASEARWQEEKEKGASQQLKLARDVFDGTAVHFRDRNYQKAYELLDRAEERCHGVIRDYPDSPVVAKAQ
jgi:hypothetical protein